MSGIEIDIDHGTEGKTTVQVKTGETIIDLATDAPVSLEDLGQVVDRLIEAVSHLRDCTGVDS